MLRVLVLVCLPFLPVLADAEASRSAVEAGRGVDMAFWLNYGACGVILGWALLQAAPRLRGIERAIDRLTRMICILLSELPHAIEAVRHQCESMMRELDEAARQRGEKDDPK